MAYIDDIGKNIRAARSEKGLSQQALAEKCDFSNTTLSAYETGKKTPGLITTAKIANALGVSIERLYYGDENISFINSVPDNGRKIVNSLYLLWEKGVICYNPFAGDNLARMDRLYGNENPEDTILLSRHINPVLRLVKSLTEFSDKRETYADPDAYLEMLLSSVAEEINREIAANERSLNSHKKK